MRFKCWEKWPEHSLNKNWFLSQEKPTRQGCYHRWVIFNLLNLNDFDSVDKVYKTVDCKQGKRKWTVWKWTVYLKVDGQLITTVIWKTIVQLTLRCQFCWSWRSESTGSDRPLWNRTRIDRTLEKGTLVSNGTNFKNVWNGFDGNKCFRRVRWCWNVSFSLRSLVRGNF